MSALMRFSPLLLATIALCTAGIVNARAAGPELRTLLPAGGQRGATVEVTAVGKFDSWPVQVWVDRPGITVSPAGDKGKLSVVIAADAQPGTCWIRLYDAAGASAPLPFIVGTLAEMVESESNNAPAKAQQLAQPAMVVNGRLGGGGDVDTFGVSLQAGQALVASLAGHEALGSPMDCVLQLVGPRGNVVAYNHDQRGLDPEITFHAPTEGNYLVRLFGFPSQPNSTIGFAGGDQYVYRLTLTTLGFVDYPWPLAVTRGRESRVELIGWNVPESLAAVNVKSEGELAEIADAQLANVATVIVEPHETVVESEPNDATHPQAISLPVSVSGRIETARDVDVFAFEAKKDEAFTFELKSRELGFPIDGLLQITDAAGKSLARVDDVSNRRDPLAAFTAPADGSYRVVVSDLTQQGSSRHVYLLRATRNVPDFQITADAAAYTISPGKPAEITLSVERQHSFAEEIGFHVVGLPEFVKAAEVVSAASGDSAKSVKLALSAESGTFSGPIRIVAQAKGDSKAERTASAALPIRAARLADLWLTVAAPPAK